MPVKYVWACIVRLVSAVVLFVKIMLGLDNVGEHRLGTSAAQYYVRQRQYVREILNNKYELNELAWRVHA